MLSLDCDRQSMVYLSEMRLKLECSRLIDSTVYYTINRLVSCCCKISKSNWFYRSAHIS